MAAYSYKAAAADGKLIEGVIEAPDDRTVALRLQDMGYIPIKIGTQAKRSRLSFDLSRNQLPWSKKRVRGRDILVFTQELYTLTRSGLPLDRSLSILAGLTERPAMREVIEQILKDIKGGKSLSEALSAHPAVFSKIYVNMVRAGEAGGFLDQSLERLISFQESAEELRSYLTSALIYPTLLTAVGGGSILVLILFVVPKFAAIFEDAGIPLPLPMQILTGIATLLSGYWWLGLGLLLVAGFAVQNYLDTEPGRLRWDRRKLRLPLIGSVLRKIEVARFARTLGTLLKSAVPLLEAMNIVKDVIDNRAIAATMDSIKTGIKKGEGLALPIRESGVFPPFALHLLEVGEESGKLDSMLLQIAEAYEQDVRNSVKRLIAFFEPAMVLAMGIIIGTVVVSMLAAIFSIYEVPL